MNIILSKQKIKGIGLIEVLISTVIIAVGLLALASMQGDFLAGSADNKARAQAQVIAERKVEELKNLMQGSEFTSIAASTSAESIGGVNETFSRSWTIASNGDAKRIVVSVTWGSATPDETVTLTNDIVFASPASSASLAEFGEEGNASFGQAPNPNQNASESVEDTVDLFDASSNPLSGVSSIGNDLYTLGGSTYRDDGNGTTGSLVTACSGLDQFDIDLSYPGNYPGTYTDSTGVFSNSNACVTSGATGSACLYTKRFFDDGVEVIQLYTQHYTSTTTGSTTTYTLFDACIAEHRYFGGTILPVKGVIRTEFTLDDIKVDHNKEDMFCSFYADAGVSEQPYACYVGGNCDTDSGTTNPSATECSVSTTARKDNIGPGGFSGNVGIINVDDNGSGKESVCFKDDLDGTSTEFFTARKYKTTNASHGQEEGINEPYLCQDFYVVGRQANVSRLSAKCTATVGTTNLPPQEVVRSITGSNTVVTTENTVYCTPRITSTYIFTVTITGGIPTTVETESGVACVVGSSSSEYICTETTSGTSISIYSSNSSKSGSCIISNLSSSNLNRSCDGSAAPDNTGSIVLTAPPSYSLSGTITGINGTGGYSMTITADSFIGTPLCTFTTTTFNCSISTAEASVRMEISKGRASDSCNKNGLDGSTTTFTGVCLLEP